MPTVRLRHCDKRGRGWECYAMVKHESNRLLSPAVETGTLQQPSSGEATALALLEIVYRLFDVADALLHLSGNLF